MSRSAGFPQGPGFLKALRGGKLFLAVLAANLLLLWGGRAALNLYVEVLWFDSMGYLDVFWTRRFWQWGVVLLVVVATAVIIYLNLARVARTFGGIQVRRRYGDLEISEQIPRRYIRTGLLAVSVVLSLWLAAAISADAGLAMLLMVRAPVWGVADPVFGHDLSFYAFTLPVINGVLTYALILGFFLFAISAVGYGATGSARWIRNRLEIDQAPRVHLATLLAAFLLLLGIRFWVARYLLLLDGSSGVQGIFGFADANARLPAFVILSFVSGIAGLIVLWSGMRRRTAPMVGALGALAIAVLLVGEAFPAVVQRFRVEPNELAAETEFIQYNMDFTREGFGLTGIRRERYDYRLPQAEDEAEANAQLAGMPIWTRNTLYTTFRALEARFRYYDFPVVAFDRYPTEEGLEPFALSVREVDPQGIEDPNWQNRHIRERYITGVGVVASNAARQTRDGRPPMFLRGIPPEFIPGPGVPDVELRQPSVFFGSRQQLYAVVNPGEEAFLDPQGRPGVPGVDFPEGVLLDSPFRTLAFAARFADANLLFASEVSATSRFVFRRNVLARIREVAPFVTVSANPYPVITEGRIHWVVDGFTTTPYFPLASAYEAEAGRRIRYMRNSVKVTVDAVTGETLLYAADPASAPDPLLEAYRSAFPTLFRDLEEMPEGLRAHLRYPRELVDLQSVVLLQYHQETPPVFHGQQDVWTLSTELSQGLRPVTYRPEYGVFRLPGEDDPDFFITNAFVPAGRQNLAGLLMARWHHERSGELVLYDIPVELQVPGPRQIEALVEQDPTISQQFALWRQSGSQVWTGHLHVVPVGGTLFYMEPIFLAAEEDAIPELRRFVVSDGQRVVMELSLAGAIRALVGAMDPATVVDLPPSLTRPDAAAPGAPRPAAEAIGSVEALELLEEAERRLREGDWQGFGSALSELRTLLERLSADGTTGPPPNPGG